MLKRKAEVAEQALQHRHAQRVWSENQTLHMRLEKVLAQLKQQQQASVQADQQHQEQIDFMGEEIVDLQMKLESIQEGAVADGAPPLCPICMHSVDWSQAGAGSCSGRCTGSDSDESG